MDNQLRLANHDTQSTSEERGTPQIIIRLKLSQLLNKRNFSNRDLCKNIAPLRVTKHMYVSMN